MAAPKGNKFWLLRSMHSREKLFATPDLMWKAACEYFQWCEENPLIEVDFRGKYLQQVDLPKMRAFTMQGLCRYLDCNTMYFNEFAESIKGKEDEISKAYSRIITRIRETIFDQKFSGAAAGFLKENIIARELGISDKADITADIQASIMGVQINIEGQGVLIPTSEKQVIEAMEKEKKQISGEPENE